MKKSKKSLIINLFIVIFGLIGLYVTIFGTDFMSSNVLLYYTIQSNIFAIIISLIFVIYNSLIIKNRYKEIPTFLCLIKYIVSCGIAITFFVFTFLLIPQMLSQGIYDYLYDIGNICLHFIVPILSIISFVKYDNNFNKNKYTFLLGTIMPLYYYFFANAIAHTSKNALFVGFDRVYSKYPYFFLDYELNGWFRVGNNLLSLGVVYYIVIIFIISVGLSILLLKLRKNNKE